MSRKFGPIFHMGAVVGPIRLAYIQPAREAQAGTMLELIERGQFIEKKIATIKAASVGWAGSNPVRTLTLERH